MTARASGSAALTTADSILVGRSVATMPDYHPPLRDIRFLLEHVTSIEELSKLAPFAHADADSGN